jgi:hypothetical protein
LYDNLFRFGILRLTPPVTSQGNWVVSENLFDQPVFEFDSSSVAWDTNAYRQASATMVAMAAASGWLNGAINSAAALPPATTDAHSRTTLTTDPVYSTGPFGNYYFSSTTATYTALRGKGRPVSASGLYHYTMRTDQLKEGTDKLPTPNHVDIGRHYVASTAYTSKIPIDTDGDTIPDYLADSNGDGLYEESTDLADWNGSPQIAFTLGIANEYVSDPNVTLTVNLTAGIPTRQVVLVDPVVDANGNPASSPYSAYRGSTISANLGNTDGWHQVWVSLARREDDTSPAWCVCRVKLDRSTPQLLITSPVGTDINIPMIQIKGYCSKPLTSLTFTVANANGTAADQGYIMGNDFDTVNKEFAKTYFQCFDVALTEGQNVVTFNAVDNAGNTVTQQVTYNVTAAAPTPTMTVRWPLDGANIAGSSFTMDGTLSDPTAVVSATVVDSTGASTTIPGVVDRYGKFWIDDIPLSVSSTVTVSATPAWGNSPGVAAQTIHVTQSAMPLTVSIDSSQIYKKTITVHGNAGAGGYTVWVNGAQTNMTSANGDWEVDNVPVPPGGTATFTITAIPSANASDSQDTDSQNQNAATMTIEVDAFRSPYIQEAHETYSYTSFSEGGSHEYSRTQDWSDGNQLTCTYSDSWDEFANGQYGPLNTKGTIAPCSWPDVDWLDVDHYDMPVTWDVSPLPYSPPSADFIAPEFCNVKTHSSSSGPGGSWGINHTRTSGVVMKMNTGGRSIAGRKSLIQFTGGWDGYPVGVAYEVTDPFDTPCYNLWGGDLFFQCGGPGYDPYVTPGIMIDPTTVSVANYGNFGSDGNRSVAIPDGEIPTVTLRAPGKQFSYFMLGTVKYRLSISAEFDYPFGGVFLNQNSVGRDAHFCVGQSLPFEASFSSDVPSVTSVVGQWGISGKYINQIIPSSNPGSDAPNVSESYICNNDLLHFDHEFNSPTSYSSETTPSWWVSDGDKIVTIGLSIKFSNGQVVSVASMGRFNIYKPVPHWRGTYLGTPHLGVYNDVLAVRNQEMNFGHYIESDYRGIAWYTQLIAGNYWQAGIPWYISGSQLDNCDPYRPSFPVSSTADTGDYTRNEVSFDDGPNVGVTGLLEQEGAMTLSYVTYLRFKPTGNYSIPITLEVVTWGVNGSADLLDSGEWWVSGSPSGPEVSESDAFPDWTSVFHNTNF